MAASDGAFPRIVYKLGGSILRGPQDYAFYAEQLRDVLSERPNTQLVVVVSAQFGETDRLLTLVLDAGGNENDPPRRCCWRRVSCSRWRASRSR